MPKKAKAGEGAAGGEKKVRKSPQERLESLAAQREKHAGSPERLARIEKRETKLRDRIAKKADEAA